MKNMYGIDDGLAALQADLCDVTNTQGDALGCCTFSPLG